METDRYDRIRKRIGRPFKFTIIGLLILLFSAIFLAANSFVIVPAGTRGVLLTWGSVSGILGEGLHFKTPLVQSVELMDVRVLKAERNRESAGTKDLQEVSADVTLNYRVNPDVVDTIYKTLGKGYQTIVIEPNMDESLKAVTAKFTAEELITRRDSVKSALHDELQSRLDQYSIVVTSVSFTDFKFSAQFTKSIEDKVTAQQKALEAYNNLLRVQYEQQQKVITAEAEANATVLKANADASAIKIVQEQLAQSPEYLEYMTILQWDGKLPYFLGSGAAVPFINIPTGSNSTAP